ncbi:hypothetical protein LCGC14_0249960 [marine sediment metagenome]|uniref:Uncharacterized protein n=1 Tax=marine sediment metagenome TaxID=412755 RepID=A0A0F9X9Z0_9ZZZZ
MIQRFLTGPLNAVEVVLFTDAEADKAEAVAAAVEKATAELRAELETYRLREPELHSFTELEHRELRAELVERTRQLFHVKSGWAGHDEPTWWRADTSRFAEKLGDRLVELGAYEKRTDPVLMYRPT